MMTPRLHFARFLALPLAVLSVFLAQAPAAVIGRMVPDAPRDGALDPSAPAQPVTLIFIHHSTGQNWLADDNGQLGLALRANNYFASDTNYGWGPADQEEGDGTIGDHTDIPNWYSWFTGPHRETYLAALYAEKGQHASYSRLATDPGGSNTIVVFKSCFPNSNLAGNPTDAPAASANNRSSLTVANAKRIYLDLLGYFAAHQEKLFVVITAPPLRQADTSAASAANARAFDNWLVSDWLTGYAHHNVAVFDFYTVLTSNGGSANTNDSGSTGGNHHRYRSGVIEHITDQGSNYLAYPTGDSHPSAAGGRKASDEFLPLLNVYYHRWKADTQASAPTVTEVLPEAGPTTGGTSVTITGTNFGAGATVALGGTAATSVTVVGPTTITAVTPAHAQGAVTVVVTNSDGQAGTLGAGFSYTAAPVVLVQPTNRAVTAGSTVAFSASASGTPPPTVRWQVSSDSGTSWSNLSGATSPTLRFTAALTDTGKRYRAVFLNSLGTATTNAVTLTVSASPDISLSPSVLVFAGSNAGGTLIRLTAAQSVTVDFSPSSSNTSWSASSNQPWLRVTPASGTGSGTFAVNVVNPGNVLAGVAFTSATITVTSSARNSPQTIHVDLYLFATTENNYAPFGQVDTPSQNATGIVGTIGVTGWALDDVGVAGVRIYRNCNTWENQSNCQVIDGNRVVYVGDAAFLAGARPDVEAAFSTLPLASRAGWGYLMLTKMLPHATARQGFGGHGPVTLYAFATDGEGARTLLGRTRLDHVPTSVTLANDTIAKPFGAIDTPGQGETVSGALANFGWVLTPDSDSVADAGDIHIPSDGSTMRVFIDGTAVGNVAYNQCRGDVGNPVPPTAYCNDDVANIFGNTSPQATLQPRAANPTRYRNLDAGRAAIGAFDIDTTTLTNGLHTLAWGVTDSAGRPEGIGSRFFTVLNAAAGDGVTGDATPLDAAAALRDSPAAVRGDARTLDGLPLGHTAVLGRTGFDLRTRFASVPPSDDGMRHLQLAELGRLELQVEGLSGGFLVANGTLRDLPPGSRLDATRGRFSWTPGPGYVGTYRLVLLSDGGRVPVDVSIRPVEAAPPGQSEIRLFVDQPATDQAVTSPFVVAGWAFDPQASIGSGIDAVHVWAQRRDQGGAAAVFLGDAQLDLPRPDVGRAFGRAQFDTAGYRLTVPSLAAGRYDLTVYAWNRRTGRWEDARTVPLTVR